MYETGALFAFLICVYHTILIITACNSLHARNLAKIGMRISWTTGTVVEDKPFAFRGPLTIVWMLFNYIIMILFSWITVVTWTIRLIIRMSQDSGAPNAVKELRWKMKNVDMTKEEIITLFEAAAA